MERLSVYQYQSAIEFLKDSIAEKKRTDESFSLRKFSRQINFGAHSYLVMILRGRRSLTLKQVPPLSEGLDLNHDERVYFQTLIQLDNAKTDEEKNLIKLWLNDLNPRREYRILEVEQYHLIADWIHMAILTLAKIKGAEITPENIYELIDHKVALPKVREAFERLLDLGYLKEEAGKITPAQESVKTKDGVPNKGAREYHKQVSKLAIEAIEEQDTTMREFQSFAVTLPEGKITLAKDMIRKFRNQLALVLESEPGHDVYQCNLQFFRLAKNPSSVKRPKVSKAKAEVSESSKLNH